MGPDRDAVSLGRDELVEPSHFSVDRLEQVLEEHAHESPVSAVDAICEAVPAFAGMVEQSDDFTIVVAKVA